MIKNLFFWLITLIISLFLFQKIKYQYFNNYKLNYSNFILDLKKDKIKKIYINDYKITATKKNGVRYITYIPIYDSKLIDILLSKKVKIVSTRLKDLNLFNYVIVCSIRILFIIFMITSFYFILKKNKRNILFFNKNNINTFKYNEIKTNFNDIAGCNEAKEEIKELVDYLKEPNKFQKLGSKMSKGILIIGPPGTGKTLLAKAIAGEAKVPFFVVSGSDFVEMFVGIGASRVRNMFNQAKKNLPCIIFIDEIDAVGKKRSIISHGGNDEREQTLNQILVEMDGFKTNIGIIIIAATNRPDILDSALIRPGRFDRRIILDLPDINGREQILKIHTRNIPLSSDVNYSIIAKGTPGFSGADLANLVNEATLFAVRNNKSVVSMVEFDKAKDKIILGTKKHLVMTEEQRIMTAYHEAGHVIVGKLVPNQDPIHKVTIIPHGKSLGATLFLPETENISISKQKLESQISTLYGGRLAEEIIYGSINTSTGSSNDIKVATDIAYNMVTKWGFSKKLGPLFYAKEHNYDILLEHQTYQNKHVSNEIAYIIDYEIKSIIKRNYIRAYSLLINNIDILHNMKDALIKHETINAQQINNLMSRKNINSI